MITDVCAVLEARLTQACDFVGYDTVPSCSKLRVPELDSQTQVQCRDTDTTRKRYDGCNLDNKVGVMSQTGPCVLFRHDNHLLQVLSINCVQVLTVALIYRVPKVSDSRSICAFDLSLEEMTCSRNIGV